MYQFDCLKLTLIYLSFLVTDSAKYILMLSCIIFRSDYEFHNFHDLQTEIHTQMNAKIGRDEQEETKDDNDSVNFFSSVDKLFDGTDEEKIKAYELLQNNRDKVCSSEISWNADSRYPSHELLFTLIDYSLYIHYWFTNQTLIVINQ